MKIDQHEFRRRYAELSDEALLSLNKDDLVDAAQTCLAEELARRGLTSEGQEESNASISDNPGTDEEIVPAATFSSPYEAQLARSLLRSAGVPHYLENEHTLAANWLWTNALGRLRLMVPASQLERAHEILSASVSEEDLRAESEADGGLGNDEKT